jgi:hypothetical protein
LGCQEERASEDRVGAGLLVSDSNVTFSPRSSFRNELISAAFLEKEFLTDFLMVAEY